MTEPAGLVDPVGKPGRSAARVDTGLGVVDRGDGTCTWYFDDYSFFTAQTQGPGSKTGRDDDVSDQREVIHGWHLDADTFFAASGSSQAPDPEDNQSSNESSGDDQVVALEGAS